MIRVLVADDQQLQRLAFRMLVECDPGMAMAGEAGRALVARLHSEQALLFPAHFAAPHYGTVGREGNEYVFVPAESPPPRGHAGREQSPPGGS
jgi:hypothetical protein